MNTTKLLLPILAGLLIAPLACSGEGSSPSAATDAGVAGSIDAQTVPGDAETMGDSSIAADAGIAEDSGALAVPMDYDSRRDTDLRGRDVDDNGVRDDVQVWLEGAFDGPALERLERHAALYQSLLLTEDTPTLDETFEDIERNGYCLWSLLGNMKSRVTMELLVRTHNTPGRYRAYIDREVTTLTATTTTAIASRETWAGFCTDGN